jgi:hypothetical protein
MKGIRNILPWLYGPESRIFHGNIFSTERIIFLKSKEKDTTSTKLVRAYRV